jgi:GTP-binding protein EngB required for normal cell division
MDKNSKQHILNDCNNYQFTIEVLDKIVSEGHITIEEFIQYNLEIAKVNELKRRKAIREGTFKNQEGDEDPIIVPPPPSPIVDEIRKVLDNKVSLWDINDNIKKKVYTYDDLLNAGISQKVITSIKYFFEPRNIKSYKVEELPVMESGRTDVFFIGVPAAGKSTMLGGLLKFANKNGTVIPDTFNTAGNVYQAQLVTDLDRGVLPKGTVSGSYNYIATSLKDEKGITHPFNIVEVPGENYIRIFNDGIDSEEVKGFVKYIKNNNRKILIFVIDSLAHEKRYDEEYFNALDQSLVYVNILNMFKDHGVLEKTDAIYLVANKFDAIKGSRFLFSDKNDEDLALEFLNEEFLGLINNCKDAREKSKRKFQIKVFPFSIGKLLYYQILEEFNTDYARVIVKNLLDDSIVVKGGKIFKNLF